MSKPKTIILGAGLAGLSAAFHLKKNYQIFEKENKSGGLCRSYKVNGFTFDYDGHLLHFRKKSTREFVGKLLYSNLSCHRRNSFIRYLGYDVPYPFQANFLKLPPKVANECLQGLKEAKNGHCKDYPNFKLWVYAAFGEGIAKHFMLPYNQKFWTIPCKDLTCEWLDGFVPVLKFSDVIKRSSNAMKSIGYNANFYYPARGGIEELPLALERNIGEKINLNSEVTEMDLRSKEIIINHKQKIRFNHLISSIPLPELNKLIRKIPAAIKEAIDLLNYNSILVFNIGIKGKIPSDKHWIYFPERKIKYFRIGFYNSFSSGLSPDGHSSIYVECSYSKNSPVNIEKIKEEIAATLVREKVISSYTDLVAYSVLNIKYGYPIYDHNYRYAVSTVTNFLSGLGVYSIGRYGSWKYMTMEDVLLEGQNIALRI